MDSIPPSIIPAPGVFLLPDARVFRAHLAGGSFRAGVSEGRWRLISMSRPFAVIAVSAAPRSGAPSEYEFRFDFTNYPQDPLTAALWDVAANTPMPSVRWPGGSGRVQMAFNPGWRMDALYLPCDRTAIVNHDNWRSEHPEYIWSPDKDITFYLEIIYDYLHSGQYTGLRGS